MNDDRKDSPEVREFRRLLAQIRQFCDDDAEELRGLVGDESVSVTPRPERPDCRELQY